MIPALISVSMSTLAPTATIILVNCLTDHILSSGLELMEGLFAPSLVDVLGTTFMLAYLSPSAPMGSGPPAPLVDMGGLQATSCHMGCLHQK